MKRKILVAFFAMVIAAGVFAEDFPAYLKMEGTKIIGHEPDIIPANLVIPKGVTEIGDGAFAACMKLTSVKIPDTVTSIGTHAFIGCAFMKTINIPNSVQTIGAWAFSSLSSISSITIPESVKSIGANAFMGFGDMTFGTKTTVRYLGTVDQWMNLQEDLTDVHPELLNAMGKNWAAEGNKMGFSEGTVIKCKDGDVIIQ